MRRIICTDLKKTSNVINLKKKKFSLIQGILKSGQNIMGKDCDTYDRVKLHKNAL